MRKERTLKSKKSKNKPEVCEWKTGLLFVKENTADEYYLIEKQNHRVRTINQYECLFEKSKLEIVYRKN